MEVKVVRRNGNAVLVEYATDEEGTRRVVVPREQLGEGNEVEKEALDMGLSYGVEWERILDKALPTRTEIVRQMARRLRDQGIWSTEDATLPNLVEALRIGLNVSAASVIKELREEEYGRSKG